MIKSCTALRLAFATLFIALGTRADDPSRFITPEKGMSLGMAYQLGNIENFNLSNGGLTLRIPIAQLPVGPAAPAGVTLVYNSKYWQDQTVGFQGGSFTHLLQASPSGGWRLKYDYELRNTFPDTLNGTDPCAGGELAPNLVQLLLMVPDGSEHKMYASLAPGTYSAYCEGGTYRMDTVNTASPQTWYSLDGSFLRLVTQPGANAIWPNNSWTLYEPGGGRVVYVYLSATGGHTVTRYDKNGNTVTWSTGAFTDTDSSARTSDTLADEFGHSIVILHHAGSDEVQQQGNGAQLSTIVNYGLLSFQGLTYGNSSGGPPNTTGSFDATQLPESVTSVQLPARLTPSGANYSPTFHFAYNGRYKELTQMTLPTGAVINYTWGLDNAACGGQVPAYYIIQINPIVSRILQYSGSPSETTYYDYNGATPPGRTESSCVTDTVGSGGDIGTRIMRGA